MTSDIELSHTPPAVPERGETLESRIRWVADICERAAAGDLEARVVGLPADGDFGRLCRAINQVLDISDSFVREASAAMEHCSQDQFHRPILLKGLKGAYRKSAAVINRAGVKMQACSRHLSLTGTIAQETAESVTLVAAACEELTSSTSEISRQTASTSRLTEQAVGESEAARSAMEGLNDVARRIQSVVGLIHKIAGQTNLLALNATIEAARAGEHGKGFAVVANEVKELSRNSARATEEIGREIERMQASTRNVTASIQNISTSVQRINEGAGTIARSLGEQVEATGEISRHVSGISEKTRRISEGIGSVTRQGARKASAPAP